MNHTLDVKAMNRHKIKPDTGTEFKELDFGITLQRLQEEYMDIYEGNSRDCCFEFLNRSVPIYPKKEIILKPDEQKLVKVKAPFMDEISGLAIIKIIDGGTYSTLLIKMKFTCNKAILDIQNKGKDIMILRARRDDRNHRHKIFRVL